MNLYKITNNINGRCYIGITKHSIHKRFRQHLFAAHSGKKSYLYDAIRSYGNEHFSIEHLCSFSNEEAMLNSERNHIIYMKLSGQKLYNIKDGGNEIFGMRDKDAWRVKLKAARIGRKPAQGMKHTDTNKKLFSDYGKLRWDLYGRYPDDITELSFKDAHNLHGISKTHYYRLRKQRLGINEF